MSGCLYLQTTKSPLATVTSTKTSVGSTVAMEEPSRDEDGCGTPPLKSGYNRVRRGAVSNEVCTEEDAASYVKKVRISWNCSCSAISLSSEAMLLSRRA